MPGTPFKRVLLRLIREKGGWSAILERVASGETITSIAEDYGCSRPFLSNLMNRDPKIRPLLEVAQKEAAGALADQAVDLIDAAPADRDSQNKALNQFKARSWLAGKLDRERFGENVKPAAQFNIGQIHLQVLKEAAEQRRALAATEAKAVPAPAVKPTFQLGDGGPDVTLDELRGT